MKSILFLDIDGVLNSRQYIRRMNELWDDPKYQIDPDCVVRLNKITDETGANIVVSSTWRIPFLHTADGLTKLQDLFSGYGITGKVVGMTPDFVAQQYGSLYVASGHRGDEITAWLTDNPEVDNFVILDDETVTGYDDRLIKTEFDTGLLDSHVERAIIMLGKM
jgi:hypothetical protein